MTVSYDATDIRNGRAMSLTGVTTLPDGYRYPWLYIIHADDETLYGVLFNNSNIETADPRFFSIKRSDVTSSPVTHDVTVVDWWPQAVSRFLVESAPTAPPTPDTPDMAEAVAQARAEERQRAEERFEQWKSRATSIAHEYAEHNGLCSEFDRCMADIGLPGREREYRVDVSVSAHVYVTASSDDEAADLAHSYLRTFDGHAGNDGERFYVDSADTDDVEIS